MAHSVIAWIFARGVVAPIIVSICCRDCEGQLTPDEIRELKIPDVPSYSSNRSTNNQACKSHHPIERDSLSDIVLSALPDIGIPKGLPIKADVIANRDAPSRI